MKRQTKEPDGEIMTLNGAADYLHCHPQTISRLLAKRAIPAFRLGIGVASDWRFRRSDLDKWIKDQTVVVSEIETRG
jgi:excisionase family DNA binding protein